MNTNLTLENLSHNCLNNNLTYLHKSTPTNVAHIAFFVRCGTRFENSLPNGICHFFEHMLFKGTQKRNKYQLLTSIEKTGCDLNAYTTKEEIVIHASFIENNWKTILSLLLEIIFDPVFPYTEIEKEKRIILDEIYSIQENPSELIADELELLFFKDHSLGLSITGNKNTINKINANQIENFYKHIFLPAPKIIIYSGSKKHTEIAYFLMKNLTKYLTTSDFKKQSTNPPVKNNFFLLNKKKRFPHSHTIIAGRAFGINDPNRITVSLLMNMLGGNAFSARLNWIVREKLGLTYHIEAQNNVFSDTGYWSIYFSSDFKYKEKIHSIIEKEIYKLKTLKLSSLKLDAAKKQYLGQLAVYLSNPLNEILTIGHFFLHTQSLWLFDDFKKKLENIDQNQLIQITNLIFDEKKVSVLSYN